MSALKKILYITDQDEYMDHSFIAPLFERYLKKYFTVDIVYFTEFKSDFGRKDAHRFIVPTRYKNVLLDELKRNDVPVGEYAFVIVRNDSEIMRHVLKEKDKYAYKTAFRFSFPKRIVKRQCDKDTMQANFFEVIKDKFKTKNETKIINQCDLFLPTSKAMHEYFFPSVNIKTILCPSGIDPNILHPNVQHEGAEKRFIYEGTLDKLRAFETVLTAFSKVHSGHWKLSIVTRDSQYALEMVRRYADLEKHIEIHHAKNRRQLLDLIAHADIGLALLPDIPFYNTSTPVKIFDYYASGVPCMMTGTKHNHTLFTQDLEAWFSVFEQDAITRQIETILTLSKEAIAEVGRKGQARLLESRNYEKIAQEIAMGLEAQYEER
jgi:hypothetical protein